MTFELRLSRPLPAPLAPLLACLLPAVALGPLGCGSSKGSGGSGGAGGHSFEQGSSGVGGGAGSSTGSGLGGSILNTDGGVNHGKVVSISVEPPTVTVALQNGTPATQAFTAVAHYADKTQAALPGAQWLATDLAVGTIDGTGTFTATGAQGGVVTITATSGKLSGVATLTVDYHVKQNPGATSGAQQQQLLAASTKDAAVAWEYPYDQTVFPRGVVEPSLMWQGGAAGDLYLVRLKSSTFELESFTTAPAGNFDFDGPTWDRFLNSTSGAAELVVARLAGNQATVVVDQHWTIAPASMRGTIYYWAIDTGRVMRIKPGAAAPDDFLGPGVTCPSCHTVSANGSHLVMNEGTWPDETSIDYNLKNGANDYSGLFTTQGSSQWALPAVSADGKVVIQNFASLRGPIGQQTGGFDAVTGNLIQNTGVDGVQLFMPSFSPDDRLLAYVTGMGGDLHAYDWDEATQHASNDRLLQAAGANGATNFISFPTASPDHGWLVYQRSSTFGSLGNPADLYLSNVQVPGVDVPLDNLNGATYPFAAGDRDRHLNYEPTFAPVAAGGFFWVVFHSRRTFGNQLNGPAFVAEADGVKQLWVAAIDLHPMPGKDPSHPAFHLPGQSLATLNMRGYWALDPCKGDGKGCATGTECCGGYCDGAPDGGQAVCKSQSGGGCSNDGDHCTKTSDCCNAPHGSTCINSVCSEAGPQ